MIVVNKKLRKTCMIQEVVFHITLVCYYISILLLLLVLHKYAIARLMIFVTSITDLCWFLHCAVHSVHVKRLCCQHSTLHNQHSCANVHCSGCVRLLRLCARTHINGSSTRKLRCFVGNLNNWAWHFPNILPEAQRTQGIESLA